MCSSEVFFKFTVLLYIRDVPVPWNSASLLKQLTFCSEVLLSCPPAHRSCIRYFSAFEARVRRDFLFRFSAPQFIVFRHSVLKDWTQAYKEAEQWCQDSFKLVFNVMHCVGAFSYSDTLLLWLFAFQPNVNRASCAKCVGLRVFLLPSADLVIRKFVFLVYSLARHCWRGMSYVKANYQMQLFVTRASQSTANNFIK
jgi:hypothetical protein